MNKNIITAGWLTWVAVLLFLIGLDLLRQKEKSGYEKLFNINQNPLLLLAERLGPVVAAWFPVANIEGLEQLITWAGRPYGLTAEIFIGIKVMSLGIGFVIGSGLALAGLPSVLTPPIALVCYFIPDYFIRDMAESRQKDIRKKLPMMLDFLVTSLLGGVELVPALNTIGSQFEGPLGEELRRATREMMTGKQKSKALRNMAQRTGVAELERFVQTLIVADERGSQNLAQTITDYIAELRTTRLLKGEEESKKLPTKIVGPLMLCIFLPMIILILAPVMSVISSSL